MSESLSKNQPKWHKPAANNQPRLFLNNSLTRKKDEFVPKFGNNVTWYMCGPTVYDKSHLGHARTYMAFDIIRRILQEYFNYDVLLIMNITDVDDKAHLWKEYIQKFNDIVSATLQNDLYAALVYYTTVKFKEHGLESFEALEKWSKTVAVAPEKDPKFTLFLKTAKKANEAYINSKKSNMPLNEFLEASKDVLSFWLDHKHGQSVTDPAIYRDFAAYWESEFFIDMQSLNIQKPDILTRVSEYVPEITTYITQIQNNGYAYELDGSVYFDTQKFGGSNNHDYAKLCPWATGNESLIKEGEGALGCVTGSGQKKHANDFALWKKSKLGEPEWDSPFGKGRPGWHIECSVMASEVLGDNMDIHSGGIDLAFPHHDNELAQSEAHYDCQQWVNYFMHAGHLHIENMKMSKSLKNFLSIRETLQVTSAATLRLMFLMHQWDSVFDYSADSIAEAKGTQNVFENYLALVRAMMQEETYGTFVETGYHNYEKAEKSLVQKIGEKQHAVRAALCDNFCTPAVISELKSLISLANLYIQEKQQAKVRPNTAVLVKVGVFVTRMMRIFGVFGSSPAVIGSFITAEELSGKGDRNSKSEEILIPILHTVSAFRDNVRLLAQQKADSSEILKSCDKLRDFDFPEHGIVLEDREGTGAMVKLVDKEFLLEQRQEKKIREEQKLKEKLEKLRLEEERKKERLEKGKVAPEEMFKQDGEYSAWDDKGIPTTDKEGVDVTKSRRKKLEKEQNQQVKLHKEYLESIAK